MVTSSKVHHMAKLFQHSLCEVGEATPGIIPIVNNELPQRLAHLVCAEDPELVCQVERLVLFQAE
jgi:hypothetical protein